MLVRRDGALVGAAKCSNSLSKVLISTYKDFSFKTFDPLKVLKILNLKFQNQSVQKR